MKKTYLSTMPDSVFGVSSGRPNAISFDRRAIYTRLMEKHRIEFMNRFKWEGLPEEIDQDMIERLAFYRGKGFLFKYNDTFWVTPFVLASNIDAYGRYKGVTPTLFNGVWDDKLKRYNDDMFLPSSVSDKVFDIVYNKKQDLYGDKHGVIFNTNSLAISQDLPSEAETIPAIIERLLNTVSLIEMNNINGAKTYMLQVDDEAQKLAVEQEFQNFDSRVLDGKRVVVVVGNSVSPIKEFTSGNTITDTARYWQSYTAWDNLRKDLIGLTNGGQHLKMEHTTEAESTMSATTASLVLEDALRQRKKFCELANHVWGLNITVEVNPCGQNEITEPQGAHTKQAEGSDASSAARGE